MRYTKTVCSSILASAMALSAAPALAADEPDRSLGQDRAVSPSQSREIQEALRRDLDLTATQARRHEALQAKAL